MSKSEKQGAAFAERREYHMTAEEFANMMTACCPPSRVATKPIPGSAPPLTPQERANIAWQALGRKHGFRWDTAEPALGKGLDWFTAVPLSADGGEQ